MKKGFFRYILFFALLTLFIPSAAAQETSLVKSVWENIVWIFALGWITEATNPFTTFIAFVRFTMAIITFVVVYELFKHFATTSATKGSTNLHLFSERAALIIALAIALMSSAFFPTNLLMTIVVMYGTFVAFCMVFVPVFMAIWLAYGMKIEKDSHYLYGVRVIFLVIAIWLLRILAQWAQFTVTSTGLQEFATNVPTVSAEQSAAFLVKLTATLTALNIMADFGTFVLVLAILYNLNHWLFPDIDVTKQGKNILSAIPEAIRERAEAAVGSTANRIKYPSLTVVERELNNLIVFFRTLDDNLRAVLTAARRPANPNRAVQSIRDDLGIPIPTFSRIEGAEGYNVHVSAAEIPTSLRSGFQAALQASTVTTGDAHAALRQTYDVLSNSLENNLVTQANAALNVRQAYQRERTQEITHCINLTRALLAQNKLTYRGR